MVTHAVAPGGKAGAATGPDLGGGAILGAGGGGGGGPPGTAFGGP